MRVLLIGRPTDRARLRPQLLRAGLTVIAEAAGQPGDLPEDIDAIVVAPARRGHAGGDDASAPEPLTARERDVLALVAEGLPNKAIAAALGISDQTVKFHVAAIIGKLGAANRTDAVRRAVRRGLVVI